MLAQESPAATGQAERAHTDYSTPDIDRLLAGHFESQSLARRYSVIRNRTDLGNSERLADHFGSVVRYDHAAGRFLLWHGTHWRIDDAGRINHLARLVVRSIYGEAARAEEAAERKALADHAKRSEAAGRIKAMIDLAKSDPLVACTTADFDRDPDVLNTESGIIDLHTGELRPHNAAAMCSKIAPVAYEPDLLKRDADAMPNYVTAAPIFSQFIAEIMLGRRDAVEYLQALFGYGVTGKATEQILAIFTGIGANGKGTLIRTVKHCLGDYAQSAPPQLIIDDSKQGNASPEIARLHAVRMLEIEETDDGDRLHESRVKWLTGGDTLVARHLFREYFEFEPCFTPILVTNHRPRVATGGRAIWRRLRLIPFDFIAEKQDRDLPEKLIGEAPAVLAWIIEGARRWYAQGMPDSETVNTASAGYQSEEDSIGPFLAERTKPAGTVHRTTLYKSYSAWAEDQGERPMTVKRFNAALRERGYSEVSARVYGDLSLTGAS